MARAATTIAVVILGFLCLASGASESRADEERDRLDDPFEITADPTLFAAVSDALGTAGYKPEKSEISPLPKTTVTLEDPEHVCTLVRMISALDDLDDVQSTSTNLEWTDGPTGSC